MLRNAGPGHSPKLTQRAGGDQTQVNGAKQTSRPRFPPRSRPSSTPPPPDHSGTKPNDQTQVMCPSAAELGVHCAGGGSVGRPSFGAELRHLAAPASPEASVVESL